MRKKTSLRYYDRKLVENYSKLPKIETY